MSIRSDLHTSLAESLEAGRSGGVASRALALGWARVAASRVVRRGRVPEASAFVCVGGATLGGSGKTRVAIAVADWLASRGQRVAFLGHGYRAKQHVARVVTDSDTVETAGDEAIVAHRALREREGACVIVSSERQRAIDLALAHEASVLVFDGPLAITSTPSHPRALSVLAVDARAPWGVSGLVPPLGDLRAPRATLERIADQLVPVDALTATEVTRIRAALGPSTNNIGLFAAHARPHRLIDALKSVGLEVDPVIRIVDHGPLNARARSSLQEADAVVPAWLMTDKCALHLDEANVRLSRPQIVLSHHLELPRSLQELLAKLIASPRK